MKCVFWLLYLCLFNFDSYLQLGVYVFRMGSALLSRFDVVFLLLDIPDESHDRRLSEHVMANRAGRGRTSSAVVNRTSSDCETSILLEHSDMPLSERLQVKNVPYPTSSDICQKIIDNNVSVSRSLQVKLWTQFQHAC